MKRRAFLGAAAKAGVAAAVTAASWPQFLREAFADEPSPKSTDEAPSAKQAKNEAQERERLAVLSDGYRRAQHAGKPLLIIVIPENSEQKWRRGEYFGSWLNHGGAEQLYALALCEVVCAGMTDIRQLVPTVGFGEPLMVLVETDRVPATLRRLEAHLPADPERLGFPVPNNYLEFERKENQVIDTRIALLGKLVHGAVAGDAAQLEQRIAQLRTAQPKESLLAVESALRSGDKLVDADVDRAAALVAQAAQASPKPARDELHRLLARVVEARLRKQRVPGSHWAQHSGCGTTVEGAEDRSPLIGCGMGHVPEKSARFLYFFVVPRAGTLTEW